MNPEKAPASAPTEKSGELLRPFSFRLGSMSRHKSDALKIACQRLGIEADVQTVSAASEINAQPYGLDETYTGAFNRAKNSLGQDAKGLAIGIENGIVPVGKVFIDMAVVVVLAPGGKQYVSTSAGVEFPRESVETARLRGFDAHTAGSVLAETFTGDSTDPHAMLTQGKISRKELLVDAIVAALVQALAAV